MKRKTIQSNPLDALSDKHKKKHIDASNKMEYAKRKLGPKDMDKKKKKMETY